MNNEVDEKIKDKMREYVFDKLDELFQDIDTLEPKDRAKARMELLQHFAPKVQAVKASQGRGKSRSALLLQREANM